MAMTNPAVIAVAITGSVPHKADNPAVPITPAEQIESTHAAYEAGATVVHIHVRDDSGASSSDPERFAEVQEGVRKHCPGMLIQFSTGAGEVRNSGQRHCICVPIWRPWRPARSTLPTRSTRMLLTWSKAW